ncbi:hypothetical protein GGH92_007962, partial [Coemansia sp. RSA 2673]
TSDDEDEVMYSGSDDDSFAEEAVPAPAHKRASASRYDSDSESEGSDAEMDRSHKKRRQGRVLEVDDSAMSLEDQEKLALRLLGGGD